MDHTEKSKKFMIAICNWTHAWGSDFKVNCDAETGANKWDPDNIYK